MPFALSDLIRVLAASLFVLGPGLLLVEPLLGAHRPRGAAGVLLGLALGLGAFGLYLWTGSLVRVPLWEWLWGWSALVSVGGVAVAVRQRRRRRRNGTAPELVPGLPDFSGNPGRILTGLTLTSALLAALFGCYVSGGADAWEYLNRASAILRAGRLDAGSPYAPGLHDPYDPTFYGVIATLTKLAGIPADQVWRYVPVVVTPLEIGVVAVVTAWVVGSASAGAAAATLYTVVYGVFFLFRNSGHHQMLGDTQLLLCLGALILHLRSGRRRYLMLGALTALAGTTYHHFLLVQVTVTIGLAGLTLASFARARRDDWRRPLLFTAVVAAGLLPAVVRVLGSHLEAVDPKAMDDFFRQRYAPLLHFGPLFIPDPFPWFFRSFFHPIPALAVLFALGGRLRRDSRAGMLGILLLAPVLIVMNPLVFPLVSGLVGLQVSTRLLNMTTYPSVLLLGWLAVEWRRQRPVGWSDPGTATVVAPGERRAMGIALAVSLLLVLPQSLIRAQGDYHPASIRREIRESPLDWRGALRVLNDRSKPGQTVLSDEITSSSIHTFAPLYIVLNSRADFAFLTPDAPRRRRALDTVMDPVGPLAPALEALVEFQVDWILVNLRFSSPLLLDRLDYLAGTTGVLKRGFEADGIVGYEVRRTEIARSAVPPEAPLRERLLLSPEVFRSFLEPGSGVTWDAAGGFGGVLGPDHVAPGDSLFVTFYYEKGPGTGSENLNAKLVKEDAYGSRARWFWRQIRVSVLGREEVVLFPRVLAFRKFQASALPDGALMADPFTLRLSPDLVPGRYALHVRRGGFPTEGAMGLKIGSVEVVRGGAAGLPAQL